MPVLHITLECALPTAHADGAFRTLVAVTDAELHDGVHLREAVRRATIIGFGGPHHVLASRQLYAVTPEAPAHPPVPEDRLTPPSGKERLDALLTTAMDVDDDRLRPETDMPPIRARRAAAPSR